MSNIVELISFTLKKGVSVSDFLLVSDQFNQDFMAAQKGYISRKLLLNGNTWTDLVLWESLEDAQNAAKAIYESAIGAEYIAFIEDEENDELAYFSVEKNY